ncbi:MAG: MFS transporter [Legionellales bacterium]|nr:MFS transporter [Legionellales bacterium]
MSRISNGYKIYTVWFLGSIFYSYQYILRVLPNIIMPEILSKFQINADTFGQFSGMYYIGYSIMHIPIGMSLDRIGPKKVIPICVLLTISGLIPLIYSDIWIYPILGRVLMGIGSSGAILGVFKIIRICFSEDKFTRMLGLSVTIGLLGAIYGGQPVNYMMSILGWEYVLKLLLLIGVILALALFIFLPTNDQPEKKLQESVLSDVKKVLTNRKVLLICLLAGCMVGPLEGFADVWGTEFLKIVYNMEDNTASTLPSMIFLGMCFGAPVLSYIADKTKAYYQLLFISAFLMGAGFILLIYTRLPTSILTILFIFIGVLCAYQILSIYKATTCIEQQLFGVTTACANMIIMFFGYVFHSVIGLIIQKNWDGLVNNGIPIYSPNAFITGLIPIILGLFIAFAGYLFIFISERKSN